MDKRIIGLISAAVVLTTTASSRIKGEIYPNYPSVNYGTGTHAQQIKHGEYLVKMGDCIACHTEQTPNAKQFAGGFGIGTPFGTIYTPNITGDKQTGIGKWSDADFIKAVREGISPAHYYYYPAFPYPYFNKLTDQDLKDIKAYLMAVPAIHQANKKDAMHFPFNIRFLQLGWRMLFFHFQKTGPYQPDPNQSELWNRGAYLVEGLGHCGMCHTPSYYLFSEKFSLAAPINKYAYTGAQVEDYFAPDITNTLLGKASEAELKEVFENDKLIGGGEVLGPMKEANHDSLKYMSAKDVEAVYTYLRSVHSEKPAAANSKDGGEGAQIYTQYCSLCHNTGAGGAPKLGNKQDWDPRIAKGIPSLYKNAIDGIGGMPAKGTCTTCTDQDIQLTVDYMVQAAKGGVTVQTFGSTEAPPPPLTIADGKTIYAANCALCHDAESKQSGAPKINNTDYWTKQVANGGFYNVLDFTIYKHCKSAPYPACAGKKQLTGAQIKAATKYLIEQSHAPGNYSLW